MCGRHRDRGFFGLRALESEKPAVTYALKYVNKTLNYSKRKNRVFQRYCLLLTSICLGISVVCRGLLVLKSVLNLALDTSALLTNALSWIIVVLSVVLGDFLRVTFSFKELDRVSFPFRVDDFG